MIDTHRRAIDAAVAEGIISASLAVSLSEEVEVTGETPSFVASITGGEPLSERGKRLVAFLESHGA